MPVLVRSDHPPKRATVRLLLAAGVASVWAISLLPPAMGRSRCIAAALLHEPCPGCGMTRAARLLLAGEVGGSLRMHPLVVPAVAATALLAVATVRLMWKQGSLVGLWKDPLGRRSVAVFAGVYAAVLALWFLRFVGLFGGPVPV
jgi:hypothetical protein